MELPLATGATDPAEAVTTTVAEVPNDQRFCPHCDKPVGRSRGTRPGRNEGFCPYCHNHFSFTPRLAAGDSVAKRYEVVGVLANRPSGWAYLARDHSEDDRWVVLDSVVEAASDDAAETAVAERQFLTTIDHPAVAPVHEVVADEGAAYVVSDYVAGKSLRTVLDERTQPNGTTAPSLPVDLAIACVLGVLPALAYLHARGLALGELRPEGVVVTGSSLRIVDLGGLRQLGDDSGAGPSVAADVDAVGRALVLLSLGVELRPGSYPEQLPTATESPVLAAHESLHRFLRKATAPEPSDRFGSAEVLADQLIGVLREEVAAGSAGHPGMSTVFGPDGLAAGVGDDEDASVADWRLLPRPAVMADDPGAGLVMGLAESDSSTVVSTISSALATRTVPASTETLLRLARAQLDLDQADQAASTLDSLTEGGGWRLWWHRGLLALAGGAASEAMDWLDPVYTELPGEVAPKLALGLAEEMAGDLARGAELYDRATRTDPAYVFGAFGLARVRLAQGDREGAVEALRRVPAASTVHGDAEVLAVQALAGSNDGPLHPPSPDQLTRAAAILEHVELTPRRRAALTVEVLEAALLTLKHLAPSVRDARDVRVLDHPLQKRPLRRALESAYRDLAHHATNPKERIELIDKANRIRPRTWA